MRILAGFLLAVAFCPAQRVDPVEFFEMKVRPVLARQCFSCHTQAKLGGLEMSSRDSLLKGGNSGPAIDVERPDESLLLQAVRHTHARLKMPPSGKLSDEEIRDIAEWIRRGAVWPASQSKTAAASYKITAEQRAWWAFQPIRKPQPPAVRNTALAPTPIDRFIVAALEEKGLESVGAASKRDWMRRVTYDLTGLPPAAEDVEKFVSDKSTGARATVVDRLLATPAYGERWARHWLDVARYSDDLLNSTQDEPYDNAFRYRDWVIDAFNQDMPYDLFVKAQLAGDVLDAKNQQHLVAGLGFYALSPQFQDDRVDVTGKAFLAMTVGCAQCHDHKFDPIPTRDYYSLLGVFTSTQTDEYPLAPKETVEEYKSRTKAVEEQKKKLDTFLEEQADQLAEVLANRTADYLRAARKVLGPEKADRAQIAAEMRLDDGTLERWVKYLELPSIEHRYLDNWSDPDKFNPDEFEQKALAVLAEQKEVEKQNMIRLGGSDARNDLARADLLSLPRDKWLLWRDLFSNRGDAPNKTAVYYYKDSAIDRFLYGPWKSHLEAMRAELDSRKKAVPPRYPYLHVIKDRDKLKTERIHIRGSNDNLGEEAPRGFLSILCDGRPTPFKEGSGRRELAEAIVDPENPLTARVIVNRIWHHLFGAGIVRTLSNFGQLGEKPSHPELLDYLAARLMEEKWSMKRLIREIVLTNTYGLSHDNNAKNFEADPDNRLVWRAARRRLDAEALRDSLLAASGELDSTIGGPPLKMTDEKNLRRTVYTFVSRRKPDPTLALFDFPNPNSHAEQRIPTATPLQQLFFLNSTFLLDRSKALAARLESAAPTDAARIQAAYRLLYFRAPTKAELAAGLDYLKMQHNNAWPSYAQVLLSANEFCFY